MNKTLLILILILLAMGTIAVFAVGIYQFGWDNQASHVFVKIIPLPAGVVNGRFIMQTEVFALHDAYLQLTKRNILESLVEDRIIEKEAYGRGLFISNQELDRYYKFLLNRFGIEEEEASQEMRQKLGLSEIEFKDLVARPDLLKAELAISIHKEKTDSKPYLAIKSAEKELEKGFDFTETAARFSDDEESKYIGGELGFVSRNELPPWLVDNAFALEIGQVSEIVVSPDGYHILKVSAKDEKADPAELQVRQIFVQSDEFEKFLEQKKKASKVYTFGKF